MSISGQKRHNHRVEDDDTFSSSEHGERMLPWSAKNVVSSDFEVAKRVPQSTNPAVAQRAFEERTTHEIFKRYPSKLTINELMSCASTYVSLEA